MLKKYFDWDEEKNRRLQKEREISFEDVTTAIDDGYLLDVVQHPNQEKYPGQKFFIVNINSYAYMVPFVEDKEKLFLKTIFPNRRATKKYLK